MNAKQFLDAVEDAISQADDDDSLEMTVTFGAKELYVNSVSYNDDDDVVEIELTENSGL